MSETSINLISPQSKKGGALAPIEGQLQRASFISLGVFIAVTIAVSLLYFFVSQQNRVLQSRRDRVREQVASFVSTEGLLLAVKSRAGIGGKILAAQTDWSGVLARVSQFAPPGTLGSISVDEKRRVVLTIKTSSIEANLPILAAVLAAVTEKRFLAPQIVSFQLGAGGATDLVISFLPVL